MARTDTEDATIQQALVFYRQHLVAERQKQVSHLPRNGKLVATPEDEAGENAYEREIQNITALLETGQGDAVRALKSEVLANSIVPVSPLFERPERDTEPYINPFTGQWVFPATKYTPGPSDSTSLSDEWRLVDIAKASPTTGNASLFKATEQIVQSPASKSGGVSGKPLASTQSTGSNSTSIRRKPVSSKQHANQNAAESPPDLWLQHRTEMPATGDALKTTPSAILQANASTPVVYGIEKESKEGPNAQGSAGRPNVTRGFASPMSLTSTGSVPTEGQLQRSDGSFLDQGIPWTLVTDPTDTAPRNPLPPIQPSTRPSHETSWQSSTWTHVMSNGQRSGTPISLHSQQGRETSWSQVPQLQTPETVDSEKIVFSRQHHDTSRSSVSAEDLRRLDFVQRRPESSKSSTHQTPEVISPEIRFRAQPTFDIARLSKFGEYRGGNSPQPLPPLPVVGDTVPSRYPSANGSVASFSAEERPQPIRRTQELGNRHSQFHTSPSGTSLNYQGNGRRPASEADPTDFGLYHHPSRAELSKSSSFLSLPRFPNDPVPQSSFTPSNPMPNDPWPTSSDPVRFKDASQFPNFTGNHNQYIPAEKSCGTGDCPKSLVSRFAQLPAGFDGASERNNGTGPILANYSTPSATGMPRTPDHQSQSIKPIEAAPQSYHVSSTAHLPSWQSVQNASSIDRGWSPPKPVPQQHQAFGLFGGQNTVMPNSLGRSISKPEDHFGAGQYQSNLSSQEPPSFNPSSTPNGVNPSAFGTRNHFDAAPSSRKAEMQSMTGSGPFGSDNCIVPNQLRPGGRKTRSRVSLDHQDGQLVKPDSRRPKIGSMSTRFTSLQDDFQVAQSIAERESNDEIAALRRIQDEFNRQDETELAEQEAFARRIQNEWNAPVATNFVLGGQGGPSGHSPHQPSSRSDQSKNHASTVQGRNPPQWRPPRVDIQDDNGIHFAPSLEDDVQPSVVVKPVKITRSSSTSQPQRTSNAHHNLNANGTFDAERAAAEEIARYEAAQRSLEESARQSALDKAKAAQAAARANLQSSQLECTACGDKVSASDTAVLPCNHAYCGICIADAFKHALGEGKVFICCNKTPAPVEAAAPFLPSDFVTRYRVKMEERASPNPIYCAKPGCAAFIPPTNLKGPMATCRRCGFVSCSLCKNPEHKGVCPPDQLGLKLIDLAGNKNWIQCSRCKAIVERDEGCLHMTCTCGYEFCYSCSGKWNQCGGKCPRRN